jgi:hypothetical protein
VQSSWSASVFLWIIIQCRSSIFKFVAPYRYFLSDENVLAVNTHSPAMNLALTHSFCLQKSDHRTNLKLGIIFHHTNHFVRL